MKGLRVFLYGGNPASVMNSLAIGLKKKQCEVKGYTFFSSKYINYSELEILSMFPDRRLWEKVKWKFSFYAKITKAIVWADVVHVFWDCNSYIRFLSWFLRKQRVVTFVGSEIRIPGVSLKYNPYFHLAYQSPQYEYLALESREQSLARQKQFARFGFNVVVWDTFHYLDSRICKKVFIIPHASVNTIQDKPNKGEGIHIIHAPTAPVAKGSRFVVEAMENVQKKFPEVKFQLLKNVTNEQYQNALAECDILLDQFIWGAYGVATQQALEMGKIVVCYLNDSIAEKIYPSDIPIQNASVDSLEEKIAKLLEARNEWSNLSKRSKEYFQKVHSPEAVAEKMLQVYTVN